MKKKIIIDGLTIGAICFGILVLLVVILANHEESSPANNANTTVVEKMKTGMPVDENAKDEFVKIFVESETLEEDVGELKKELEEHKNQLSAGIMLIEENKDKENETQVTAPNGIVCSLSTVRRNTNAHIQEIEILRPKIAEKEERIAELQKKNDAILTEISKKEKEFWATPNDDELLKKGRKLLGTDTPPATTPPPPPAK